MPSLIAGAAASPTAAGAEERKNKRLLMDAEKLLQNSSFKLKEVRQPWRGFTLAIAVAFTFIASSTFFFLLLLGLHHSHSMWCLFNGQGQQMQQRAISISRQQSEPRPTSTTTMTAANVVFGIGASAAVLDMRKAYIRSWWRPNETRGFVFVDEAGSNRDWPSGELPELRVSQDTSNFRYTYVNGKRSAVRISRIVSEMFRMGLEDVKWFVLGDDDTVFFVDNLVRVLSKYDHRKMYYVGCNSESHAQNVGGFSNNMAYGGGGFAISYPLAQVLESMQDECLERYHFLYGSDDRIQACMAELGVPLTREPGFHQLDILGDASGILAAHPIAPAVTLHHLNVIEPLFPGKTQTESLEHLNRAVAADAAGIFQQSICYDVQGDRTVHVAWGYLVQVWKGLVFAKELELPLRTFSGWYGERDEWGFPFKTRPLPLEPCLRPAMFFMIDVNGSSGSSVTEYELEPGECTDANVLRLLPTRIIVEKEATEFEGLRRQCCRIVEKQAEVLRLHVADCKGKEFAHWS